MNASAAEREIAVIRAKLEQEFRAWERLYREGAGDPRWPDGVYLNLCRAKIIWGYQRIRELKTGRAQFSMDGDLSPDLPGERQVPPYVRYDYRV